jgi:hypothetical protein
MFSYDSCISYLPDKRSVVAVSEINRQHVLRKLLDLLHDESLSVFCPTNDVSKLVVLNQERCTSKIS